MAGTVPVMGKLATVALVLATLVGIGVGLMLSSMTEVQCGGPLSLSTCFDMHRFSTTESAGIGLLVAVAVGASVGAVRVRRGRAR